MRVGSSSIYTYKDLIKNDKNKGLPEDLFLENKEKGSKSKGKLDVRREAGYIKHYIIKPNGEKILISEVKETKEMKEANDPISTEKTQNNNDVKNKNSNTKDLMQFLNLSAGVGLPLKLNYDHEKK
ncbi:hypothetical protein ACFSO7_09420 [Bacillus sp. CGMCC 1.16607]|uniref:hypothetical protein n=1 Tax=Bacillus sp. CGMCC 1.16607 TaxID=3351842 RepID=UPI003632FC8C